MNATAAANPIAKPPNANSETGDHTVPAISVMARDAPMVVAIAT